MTEHIIAAVEGCAGRLRLNRPKPIHALDLEMIRAMTRALAGWCEDDAIEAVLIDHAEGRAEALGLGVVKTLEEEIADLRASDRVDAELAELKRRLSANSNREG